jgi:hypothetical protein
MLAPPAERPKMPPETPLSVVLVARPDDVEPLAVARDWLTWLDSTAGNGEVLLVFAADAGPLERGNDPRLRIVHQVGPRGLGPSLQTAVWLARHPLLLTAPADRQVLIADAKLLFDHIDQVDLVAGWRVDRPPPWWLRVLGFVHRVLTRIVLGYAEEPRVAWHGGRGFWRRLRLRHIFGVKVHDPECPFRLYRTDVLRRIPIQSIGAFAQAEILAKANHLGCLMTETAVPWQTRVVAEADASWNADERLVLRRPDFAAPVATVPPGVPSGDLIASDHEPMPGNTSAPSELGM